MIGQWVGRYRGTSSGLAVIDVDDCEAVVSGSICLFNDDTSQPGGFALIEIPKAASDFEKVISVAPFHQPSAQLVSASDYSGLYPNSVFPNEAKVRLNLESAGLKLTWETNVGSRGTAFLRKKDSKRKSPYRSVKEVSSWREFKQFVGTLERDRYIFRGQPAGQRLTTAFHRTNRSNIARFVAEDIPTVSRHIGALIRHVFDFSRPLETGALYNLIQHHGYPTPLLDWTRSPYIAAYFAYRNAPKEAAARDRIRIFIFDRREWCRDFIQLDRVAFVRPHFSVIELVALENSRMVPQQALSTLSNIDDIESYIRVMERKMNKSYLRVIDLPARERLFALEDLTVMGITAGALFPGLDGACEELRGRFFGL